MSMPAIITIDAEGDNLWARPRTATTENAAWLSRFQALCERHGLRPTYLANHEMAVCPVFREFGRDVLARDAAEIGLHLHAWDSPPAYDLTGDDPAHHPYLMEYPPQVMRRKVAYLLDLLEQAFGTKIISHRAGRWAFDEEYARILVEHGVCVDCSVTPLVSWKSKMGAPDGKGGRDYRAFGHRACRLDLDDLGRASDSPLLEAPMTVLLRTGSGRLSRPESAWGRLAGRLARSRPAWFRPRPGNRREMLDIVEFVRRNGGTHLEFMLHSSELMPGGSPTFRTEADIEGLYQDMEIVFKAMEQGFMGLTLREFGDSFGKAQ